MKSGRTIVFVFILILALALIQAPDTDSIDKPDSVVEKIVLEADGNEVEWDVDGYSSSGFKVVWSKNPNPEYPTREGDKYNYHSNPETDESELDAFDGPGTYYVRVCEYLGGKCGLYSNEIQLTLGMDDDEYEEVEETNKDLIAEGFLVEETSEGVQILLSYSKRNLLETDDYLTKIIFSGIEGLEEESKISKDSLEDNGVSLNFDELKQIEEMEIPTDYFSVKAVLDYEGKIKEVNEKDNCIFAKFEIIKENEEFIGAKQIGDVEFCEKEDYEYEYKEKEDYEYEKNYEYEYEGKKEGFVPIEYGGDAECEGCLIEGECVPVCYRKAGVYCALGGELVNQSIEGEYCDNSCECESNLCANGECISGSTIQKILAWFQKLFG